MTREEAIQSIMAIVILGIIAIVAMNFEINGEILTLCIISIAGLGGYEVYQRLKAPKPPEAQVLTGEEIPKD